VKKDKGKPKKLLDYFDAYTGAPTRAAIAKLQDDFTDIGGAATEAYEQFGADPETAPTGRDIVAKTGLKGIPGAIAGLGMELAADPTSAITGGLKLATLPLVGMKALKAADVVGDVARSANAIDDTADAVKAAKEAADAANFKKLVRGSELAAEQGVVKTVQKPFLGVGGIVHAPTAEEGIKLANQNPSEWGRVVQLPDLVESRRIQRLSNPSNRFPTVRNIIRGRK